MRCGEVLPHGHYHRAPVAIYAQSGEQTPLSCFHSKPHGLGGIPMTHKVLLACLVFLIGCGPGPKTAANICPGHQTEVWDAAMGYYLEHGLKPDDLIDPRQLSNLFAEERVP